MTWHKFSIYALSNLAAVAIFELLLVFLPLDVYAHRSLSIMVLIGGGMSIAYYPFLFGGKNRNDKKK